MQVFLIALIAVTVLLLTAVPGYLLMKKKMIEEDSPNSLSKILVFFCQPCLGIYTFLSVDCTAEKLKNIGIFAILMIGVNALMLIGMYLILRKKCEDVIYRIMVIGSAFANCGFFGIPIIEALMPEAASELIIYTTVWATTMNILAWTVGSAIISRNIKYMSAKKIFLNPASMTALIAFLFFVLKVPVRDTLPELYSMIEVSGRMSTPVSMIIMGMRLARMDVAPLFTNAKIYITAALKQIAMPLIGFGMVYFLPIGADIKRVFFIICACPVASIVLNFAEIIGEGQREAANAVLLSTILSVVSLPLLMLLLPLL